MISSNRKNKQQQDDDALICRDVWNEAPSVSDRLYAVPTSANNQNKDNLHGGTNTTNSKIKKAMLRTTMGDIHISLLNMNEQFIYVGVL